MLASRVLQRGGLVCSRQAACSLPFTVALRSYNSKDHHPDLHQTTPAKIKKTNNPPNDVHSQAAAAPPPQKALLSPKVPGVVGHHQTLVHLPQKTVADNLPVTYSDISRAAIAIHTGVRRTSCDRSYFLSELCGMNVFLKNEFMQFTGSFKERGARFTLMQLKREEHNGTSAFSSSRGVIAASAGNHALALAYHGSLLNVPITVVMPEVAPLAKVDKCKRFGARVIIAGAHIGESKSIAEGMMQKEGLVYVNGYDDPNIIAGAGTLGIEIVEQCPQVDVVVVPVGGAGLIAGVSCAVKTLKPECKVYGVEPRFAASFTRALEVGKPEAVKIEPTLADGLAVPMVGPHAFKVAREYVDDCFLATEKEIAVACLRLIENEKMVVEGGGATGLTAILPGGPLDVPEMKGKTVVIPLCGGNIDTTVLGRVIDRGLAADHRLIRFVATVSDRPGGIAKLTTLLAVNGASIKDIYHERAWLHSSISNVQVKVIVEMQGYEHCKILRNAMKEAGYPVLWDEDMTDSGDIVGTTHKVIL